MKGISVRSKLLMLVVVPLFCMILLCTLSLWGMRLMNQAAHQVNEEVQRLSGFETDFRTLIGVVDAINKAYLDTTSPGRARRFVPEAQLKLP